MTNNCHLEDISSLGFSLVIKWSKLKEIVEYLSWYDPFKCFVIMLVLLSSIWQDIHEIHLRFHCKCYSRGMYSSKSLLFTICQVQSNWDTCWGELFIGWVEVGNWTHSSDTSWHNFEEMVHGTIWCLTIVRIRFFGQLMKFGEIIAFPLILDWSIVHIIFHIVSIEECNDKQCMFYF